MSPAHGIFLATRHGVGKGGMFPQHRYTLAAVLSSLALAASAIAQIQILPQQGPWPTPLNRPPEVELVKERWSVSPAGKHPNSLVFSPDSKWLAVATFVGSDQRRVTILEAGSGKTMTAF